MELQYRKATLEDLSKTVEICNQIIPSRLAITDLIPITVDARKERFETFDENHSIWVIEHQNEALGRVTLEHFYGCPAYNHTSEIAIYLDQRLRKQRVSAKTMEFIIGQLPNLAVDTIMVYIFGYNTPNLKLLKSFGFTQWGLLSQVVEPDGIKRDLVILGRHFK